MPRDAVVRLGVRPLSGPLPLLAWRWDPETDILSGSIAASAMSGDGPQATVELTHADGGIAVLDVSGGAVAGLDIVVWPEVVTAPGLVPPRDTEDGRVVLQSATRTGQVTSYELDLQLTIRTDPAERNWHMRIGEGEPVRRVRVAEGFILELDDDGGLCGCWMLGVPPFPALDD